MFFFPLKYEEESLNGQKTWMSGVHLDVKYWEESVVDDSPSEWISKSSVQISTESNIILQSLSRNSNRSGSVEEKVVLWPGIWSRSLQVLQDISKARPSFQFKFMCVWNVFIENSYFKATMKIILKPDCEKMEYKLSSAGWLYSLTSHKRRYFSLSALQVIWYK